MIKRIGFTVVAVLALSMAAQAADMFSGTWVLNKVDPIVKTIFCPQ